MFFEAFFQKSSQAEKLVGRSVQTMKQQRTDDDLLQAAVAAWAIRGLPARLDVAASARLLGFAEHDIPVLQRVGKLTPLGDPAPNAPKWFSAIELIRLAADHEWLSRASRETAKYWRNKRERCGKPRANESSAGSGGAGASGSIGQSVGNPTPHQNDPTPSTGEGIAPRKRFNCTQAKVIP